MECWFCSLGLYSSNHVASSMIDRHAGPLCLNWSPLNEHNMKKSYFTSTGSRLLWQRVKEGLDHYWQDGVSLQKSERLGTDLQSSLYISAYQFVSLIGHFLFPMMYSAFWLTKLAIKLEKKWGLTFSSTAAPCFISVNELCFMSLQFHFKSVSSLPGNSKSICSTTVQTTAQMQFCRLQNDFCRMLSGHFSTIVNNSSLRKFLAADPASHAITSSSTLQCILLKDVIWILYASALAVLLLARCFLMISLFSYAS